MAIDFDKIDRSVDLKGLQADVEDAKKNGGGDFPTIPAGKYEVKLESMELKGPYPVLGISRGKDYLGGGQQLSCRGG